MRTNTMAKRAVAVTFAGALAAGALAATTGTATAVPYGTKNAPYPCKATNQVVDQTIGRHTFGVTANAQGPGSVKAGSTMKITKPKLTLILPPSLVKKLNETGVKRVKGTAKANVVVKPNNSKAQAVPIKGLASPYRPVPKKGSMLIPAAGKTVSYKVPGKAKSLKVSMPPAFRLNATLDPPVLGSISKTGVNCTVKGTPRVLRTVKVTK